MLIEIDRSMSEFDRALTGLAIDFRSSFRSRAGGFAPPTPSLFDNGNRIDDRQRCDGHGRPMAHDRGRVALRAGANDAARRQSV